MNQNDLNKYIAIDKITVMDAMKMIDLNAKGILYLVNKNGKLSGSLSDGDIRRWILKTGNLTGIGEQMCCKEVKYLTENDLYHYMEFMDAKEINSVPVLNENHEIVDIKFRNSKRTAEDKFISEALKETSVIIMAGGKGTRLYPYTKILPKPLIPIGEIPILERILNRFYRFGVTDFYLTINYKKEMIKAYFAELNSPYNIHYVEEDKPLGTAGSIRLIKEKLKKPVIIANCDSLIQDDYKKMIRYHKESKNDMTIVSSLKNTIIPYGVLYAKEQGIITSMKEKPQLSFVINTGMYIVHPEHLKLIPQNQIFHMTDLAVKMMDKGYRVGMYPISEDSFLDMGEFEEMKRMEERINSGYVE